jgi:hypothetical protein
MFRLDMIGYAYRGVGVAKSERWVAKSGRWVAAVAERWLRWLSQRDEWLSLDMVGYVYRGVSG